MLSTLVCQKLFFDLQQLLLELLNLFSAALSEVTPLLCHLIAERGNLLTLFIGESGIADLPFNTIFQIVNGVVQTV